VSLTVLRRLGELNARYNLPVLISVSRKSFVRRLAGVNVAASGAASLAAELFAARRGAAFLRTHDVAALKHALSVWTALESRRNP
jgi:dihydropteroate synthase type 2